MNKVADIAPFHAIAISREAHALEEQGRSILHMEFGQPSTGAPTRAIVEKHWTAKNHAKSRSCNSSGNWRMRCIIGICGYPATWCQLEMRGRQGISFASPIPPIPPIPAIPAMPSVPARPPEWPLS